MARSSAALWLLCLALTRPAGADPLAVIVHGARADRPSRDEIAQIYLKQRRFWADGERIVPVNRESESPAREAFVSRILGTTARQLVVYWNRQYFQGVLPPATLASDEAVRRFVASEKRAIGYVHPGTVDGSVRVVLQID